MSGKLKLVKLDHRARIRRTVKELCKDLVNAKHLTYVIQREESLCIRSTHRDDNDTAEVLQKAAGSMRMI